MRGGGDEIGHVTLNHVEGVRAQKPVLKQHHIVRALHVEHLEPHRSIEVLDAYRRVLRVRPQRWQVDANSVMLFRYSALTFNGHRIHYDLPYSTHVEGHGGLLVHGPLQATLMLNLACSIGGKLPKHMAYRGVRPLVCGDPIMVDASPENDDAGKAMLAADPT